jgi:hypothetical protein
MHKAMTAALLVASLFVASVLGGCTLLNTGVNDANKLIDEANVHLTKQQVAGQKMGALVTELGALGSTPQDAIKGLEITAQIRAELQTQSTELEAASGEIAKIKTLDVDEAFKKYADLKVAAVVAQQASVDKGLAMFTEWDKLLTAIRDGKATNKLSDEIAANVKTLSDEVAALSETSRKAADAADTYAAENLPK